jgi:aryl sulfotransferase
MLVQSAQREYRTWILDSRRWAHYRPRPGDIIVTTYPKSGTTWMQRIVDLLIHQDDEPRPLSNFYPWLDQRFLPIDTVIQRIDEQSGRRALKSHLPFDGLPIHDEVSYIHVARDGRDVCMSYHNHITGFTEQMLAQLDNEGLTDETIGRPYPRVPSDAAEFFRTWLTEGAVAGHDDGFPFTSFFECERSYWNERNRSNLLLVHYNDLKANLAGEMQRIAKFIKIEVPEGLWPALVKAAQFDSMRKHGDQLMPQVTRMFSGGAARFFNKGDNQRWKGVFAREDLALYDRKIAGLPAGCANWIAAGRDGADSREIEQGIRVPSR